MRVHMVAIGGSVMHNLALDLAAAGHEVTGSDDEFYEPSKSRLAAIGLLPDHTGWFPERITPELDCVIAGMHAKADNTELIRASDLGLRIYSFPEFFGEHCKAKKRIVVAGSHGKTTTTAMIMHAMKAEQLHFDYLIGASVDGFERNVKLSNAPVVVIEGDEYPSSPLDLRPKIMHYDPDIAIITGVAWDHMNVFPTWESYVQVFKDFIIKLRDGTTLIWYQGDTVLAGLVEEHGAHLNSIPYDSMKSLQSPQTVSSIHPYKTDDHASMLPGPDPEAGTWVHTAEDVYKLRIFGSHNLQNLSAAALAGNEVGISQKAFLTAMQDFTGAAMRLQKLNETEDLVVYRDFAHAPSKVEATVHAVKERYPDRRIVACFELHTYSSLNAKFLPQYKGSLDSADHAIIFYSPHTLAIKRLPPITPADITREFGHHSLEVITGVPTLKERLSFFSKPGEPSVILLMSSGRFGQIDMSAIFPDQDPHNV